MAWAVSGARGHSAGGSGAFNNPVRGEASSATTLTMPSATLIFTLPEAPKIVGHAKAYLTHGGNYQVTASGTRNGLDGIKAVLPALSLVARGGGRLKVALPALTLLASGTVPAIGRLNANLPALTLLASGKTGGVLTASPTLKQAYSIAAYSGAQAKLTLSEAFSLSASGKTGAVGTANLTLTGRYEINATATTENRGQLAATLPSLQMAPSGQAWLVGPRLSLHAVAHEVVAVSYEAYAINLTTGVVTHYTNYPFDNILRFGSKFYGVASTGLFEIGGTLDVTAPIDAHIKTFATKLGSGQMKRVPYVYSSGRSDGGILVGITPDEGDTYEYESDWGEIPGSTNHRTQVGKGVRGVYYSFDISNIDGSSLELDSITAEPAVSQRGI